MKRACLWVGCVIAFIGCGGGGGDGDTSDMGSSSGGSGSVEPPGIKPGQSAQTTAACGNFCDLRQQAACANTEALAECEAACAEDGDREPNCSAEFASMVTCGSSAPIQCNPGGIPLVTAECSQQLAAYDECMSDNGWMTLSLTPCTVYTCQGFCHIAFGCIQCMENTDCAPTQECASNVCRERCLSDADCPGAFCSFSDVCGDPVGTPCNMDDLAVCEGGTCIDVDANLTTVEPYCTITCSSVRPCPQGYTCQDLDCRRL